MRRYEISDYDWQLLSALLPDKSTDVGRTTRGNFHFIKAMLWIACSGTPWKEFPQALRPLELCLLRSSNAGPYGNHLQVPLSY